MKSAARVLILAVIALLSAEAAELPAANVEQLAKALAKAQPGDVIVLADGTWRDAVIDLTRGGTSVAPLRVRAQTAGKVVLTGRSSLTFSAPHLVVDGLFFSEGSPEKGDVVRFNSDHGRLTNSAIVGYNPPQNQTGYYWVYFDGNHNRLDRCLLQGKNHHQPVIGNDHSDSRHNTVEYCHFKDIAHVPQNGREVFRIWGYGGNEELGPDGAFFTIANNLFEHADGESAEIISLKSNRNIVRNNTIRATRGGITNRSGNYNTIEGNFIFGDGVREAYGMRITGQNHTIAHNYIEGCSYGIELMSGEAFEHALTPKFEPILREGTVHGRVPRYNQPRNTTVAYNTFVNNSGADLRIGGSYKSGWPAAQRVLLPENCHVAHNLILKQSSESGSGANRQSTPAAVSITMADRAPPLDALVFGLNHYEGNLVSRGTIEGAAPATGFEIGEIVFDRGADGVARPVDKKLAFTAAAAASFTQVPSPFRVLSAADVGPDWRASR